MELGNCCKICGKSIDKINTIDINTDKKCCDYNNLESKVLYNEYTEYSSSTSSEDINNTYGTVEISHSKNIIIGNVKYITGPIYIIQNLNNIEQENIKNQLFMNVLESSTLNIVPRENWMAAPTKQITYLSEIPQYVIIAHTATEDGYTQSQNALLVKLIQTFHMESRKWDDIAYNFLIGCDGTVFEGRAWNIQGAHTYGYNRKSICIAFIGCFMDHLPPVCALNAAKQLIQKGVILNFLPKNYSLIGHCQCCPFESPGLQLFNEIKKWPNWRKSEFLENN